MLLDDVQHDYDVLEAIGVKVDGLIETLMSGETIRKTLRRWLVGHADSPAEEAGWTCLLAMAADLELFTPSASGWTAVDRHLNTIPRPQTLIEQQALEALAAAQFRLVRIIGRDGPDLVRLKDLATGETLELMNARIAPEAAGLATAMRLCPLASGRHVLISPLFAMDEAMLEAAMMFVRPGRPRQDRCAANLYRNVARRGFLPVPRVPLELNAAAIASVAREIGEQLTPVERLALRCAGDGASMEAPDFVLEARRLTSVDNLVDACGFFAQAQSNPDAPEGLKATFERIAELQVETIVQRARTGMNDHADALVQAAAAISGHIARGEMEVGARHILERLTMHFTSSPSARSTGGGTVDLDRVIQRIRALRTKTVDQGCTEAEAMAAAAKVAALLDRHDLTLDEVSVRNSVCEGAKIATGRKRRSPVDSCIGPLAEFCDCRVWVEENDGGDLRYVFFGLKADIEAARFLYDLIDVTFESETLAFRRNDIYLALRGDDRRMAQNSFQIGLANGISAKLAALKTARSRPAAKSTGFDLVATKHSVVDEEIARLGLHFTTRTTGRRRYVNPDAYAVGKATGDQFEPNATLSA